jgi:hypothetical protein
VGKASRLKERRLDRMRLGQATCDVVGLVSDPEDSVKIVPLVEAEYLEALEAVAAILGPDDMAHMALRDRRQSQEILIRAIREDDDLTSRAFSSVDEMMEILEVADVDEVIDRYNEMVHTSSPAIDRIPSEELDAVKKALQETDWSVLSGRSWYALKRFLGTLPAAQLLGNLHGSISTSSSTTTSE